MRSLFLSLYILLLFALPAQAQDKPEDQIFMPPGTFYDNKGHEIRKRLREESLQRASKIPINTAEVSIVHHHYMEPEQFGIMLKVPNIVTGCFDISPMEYEVKFHPGNYMSIHVKEFRRKPVKTEKVEYDCDLKSKAVSGLIVLNAKDLEERGVQEIRFTNGNIIDKYKVKVLPDSIQFIPESMVAFKVKQLMGPDKDKVVHYFSGKTLVALHVPMAEEGEDIAQAVRDLAYKSALTPIFEKEGLDTSGKGNIYYFMDPHGRALDLLNDDGYAEFGYIYTKRPYIGQRGQDAIGIPLKVFVSRPGTTL